MKIIIFFMILLFSNISYAGIFYSDEFNDLYNYVDNNHIRSFRVNLLLSNLEKNKNENQFEKIYNINLFFNHNILYKSDMEAWGKEDYWPSPMELMINGAGNCKSYATGKFFTLKKIGINEDDLKLAYVKYNNGKELLAHLVLLYKNDKNFYVLDNLMDDIQNINDRKDLKIIYSFNTKNSQLGYKDEDKQNNIDQNLIIKWKNQLLKSQKEGW